MIVPHVDNLYTLLGVIFVGVQHIVTAALNKRRQLVIKMLVNGRLSENQLRIEQLTSALSAAGIPVPPPAHPVVRTIIVKDNNAGNS